MLTAGMENLSTTSVVVDVPVKHAGARLNHERRRRAPVVVGESQVGFHR